MKHQDNKQNFQKQPHQNDWQKNTSGAQNWQQKGTPGINKPTNERGFNPQQGQGRPTMNQPGQQNKLGGQQGQGFNKHGKDKDQRHK